MTESFEFGGEASDAGVSWLLSMTDLISLLVAFFIMLFSMSTIETAKWKQLAGVAANEPSIVDQTAPQAVSGDVPLPRLHRGNPADLGYLAAIIGQKLSADTVLKDARIARSENGLVIALPDRLLFASGKTDTSPGAAAALDRLGGMLRTLDNTVEVRGHTDPTPIHTADFPSNWELSLARARVVAAALRGAGYEHEIIAFGDADARFGDLSTRLTQEQRLQLARRVDVILRPTGAEARP